ncbi:cell division protein FtsQ/DivIB [Aeromicrobium wangtongii]|uniref:FtsQ-type POTRA domain-containing protein n=1 Tax=Aeromicrobium wangtongii TaxID=2969247 RepID=A0ABY5MDP5_9ACTN|nr:FtsQ-type POTRA domain-containing protein [Aeromicrobium wangtongii]MCD9197552.1 FtsQ-type POTRA domain-containing protein [Aeromicrobium wangtongii]UUP15044.1 FtsQ-type POTRA domain-containing protein [Aeromicrobium wangtongii]
MTLDPFSERIRSERRRRWIRIAIAVLAVAGLGALVWLIWFSSVLAVRDVEVAGRTTLKQAQVLRAAQVPAGRPMARVDLEAIEGRIAALNRVDTVEVSRSWPRTVSIRIVERKAVVWATVGGQVRGIDRNGIAFRSYGSPPKDLLEAKITLTDSRDRVQTFQAVAEVVVAITGQDPALLRQIRSVSAASKDSIELELDEGRTVVWGSSDKAERKLVVLDSLLAIDAARYDVSAPDQPTTRE